MNQNQEERADTRHKSQRNMPKQAGCDHEKNRERRKKKEKRKEREYTPMFGFTKRYS